MTARYRWTDVAATLRFDTTNTRWNTALMDTQKLIDEACPIINQYGWAYYFVPATVARGEGLGLDTFQFYFLGRGGVLGDVDSSVVSSAFGYFNPAVIAMMWDAGRAKVEPREAARQFFEAAHEYGREHLEGLSLDGFVTAASKVIDAAKASPSALSLFAGTASEPWPSDPAAAAMHALVVLREFRGSAHLVAIVASELHPKLAHYVRRPEMFGAFGWPDSEAPDVSDADRATLKAADELTDRLVTPAYATLDDDDADAFVSGLRAIAARFEQAPPTIPT
jgi:hypothetical protein